VTLFSVPSSECWSHEESKGWRRVAVETECDGEGEEKQQARPHVMSTACGDQHSLGLDTKGRAYSLPSPILALDKAKVTSVACGKEHCILLTHSGQVYTWGGGSRGQLGHGMAIMDEQEPRLLLALDGLKVTSISAGGWHSAAVSLYGDLYLWGWNESGQLAQTSAATASKGGECLAAVEKLLMACCTMAGTEEPSLEVYGKDQHEVQENVEDEEQQEPSSAEDAALEPEKEALTCYTSSCGQNQMPADVVTVQMLPVLVQLPGDESVSAVACGSRHTVALTHSGTLWSFGWNKYGQLGLGHTLARDAPQRMPLPKSMANKRVKMVRCGDWGTAVVVIDKK